jgi:hypothetical protein
VTASIEKLKAALEGRRFPGGLIGVERHESLIADHALRAEDGDRELAHPIWFVIASMRGMGISVDDLCELAGKEAGDTLLYGTVEVVLERPLEVDRTYRTTAEVTGVDRRTTRDGATLDSVVVRVGVRDDAETYGSVTSTYLFKRGSA